MRSYRDRADAENAFDELKNQWGWGGFTTHDLHRCQLAARLRLASGVGCTSYGAVEPNHRLEPRLRPYQACHRQRRAPRKTSDYLQILRMRAANCGF